MSFKKRFSTQIFQFQNKKCSWASPCDRNTFKNALMNSMKSTLSIEHIEGVKRTRLLIWTFYHWILLSNPNFKSSRKTDIISHIWSDRIRWSPKPPKHPEIQNWLFTKELVSSEFNLMIALARILNRGQVWIRVNIQVQALELIRTSTLFMIKLPTPGLSERLWK